MDFRTGIVTTIVYALTILTVGAIVSVLADESLDTREGETLTLKCRFSEQQPSNDFTYYWARWTTANKFDNVAINNVQLNTNYRIDFRPKKGVYDLHITNTSYSRDNGRFECRIKASGTGADVHQEYYNLTVLTPPQPPLVAPGTIAVATEDKKLDLTCSSIGGSPDPTIMWYRVGSNTALQAPINRGGSKDLQTTSTLSVLPRREDDGAKYRCVVWNRAMPEGHRLETLVTLSVNYYPRVKIGPENPLRVERDTTAKMECSVDAKPNVPNVRWTRNGRFISSSRSHSIQRVSVQDAGEYGCSADNGLGKVGEQLIILDVLYAPVVVIESKTWEAEERETVTIRCNVTSNPPPITIEWFKEGSPDFRYAGDILQLREVKAEHAGTYVCRAVNMLKPYGGKMVERIGNSTVALLVRHRPGQAYINPNKPVVHVGNGVTLTCSANPPGWPVPQFRWFKDAVGEVSSNTILAQGPQYVIPRAHLGSEGSYHCHAVNELGHGPMATIKLEVHQPPQFIHKIQQHMTKRVGDTDFSASCHAKGKPRPTARWLKDGRDITADANMYRISTSNNDGLSGMVTVQSTLVFQGKARPHKTQLLPSDRGLYTCLFENEVSTANLSMHLRIEHGPIVLHQYNKVAYEIKETAEVLCRVQAYPKPEFQWHFGTNTAALSMSSDGHYEINTTTDNNDIYTSVLRINNLKHQDYGDYTCRVGNSIETIRAPIRLQPKGPPEKPTNLHAADVGSNYVSLVWDPGFDGGISNTKFFVSYRKVAIPHHDQLNGDCGIIQQVSSEWMEFDCQRDVPCSVTPLDQHQSYVFKVKAFNVKGNSEPSNEIATTTKVSKVPTPLHVGFDPETRQLGVNVGATCLSLIAIVESIGYHDSPISTWQVVQTISLAASGSKPTYKEEILDNMISARRSSARSLGDDDLPMALEEEIPPRVRVKLCLKSNHEHCGEYVDAEIGPAYVHDSSFMATPTLIAIVVSCVVFALFVGLLLMFCRCKKNSSKKSSTAKDYEMDSVRPSIVAQQSQAPPPYYPTTGLDNKALEHSMDLALAMEDQKTSVYATQNGYGYHSGTSHQVPSHTIVGQEWVTMGYAENSYTNSNNGGSVNSQDSIWQLKMSAAQAAQAAAAGGGTLMSAHHYAERQAPMPATSTAGLSYGGYDPLVHSAYGTVEDYASYPHLATTPSQQGPDDVYQHASRQSQNPSRQDYCGDSYASVHKPKKRLDQPHLDSSSYHDVSGLPDPYLEHHQLHSPQQDQEDSNSLLQHQQQQHQVQQQQQQQQQQMSLNYDENLESGYSTPNSRNRRVIREIIV
ncbi:cell adhesion molecule Dscam2-like [Sabethes cyaneus]|uniref:cell adhesion molecule Dscam2-like n=1 Tax=Sabethes cyaneus TaxID=53552 RepID=UPI00237EC760|nr:cell adhesion molecule Dscam2-like [Sabethes cyaneus]XP_053696579.1 cell adhesion molecule Dscam2-like [Sabethes cyaneus]XP_053696581.1 cell adhesion molecule Dscam2-like [Sabethes cyaneus]